MAGNDLPPAHRAPLMPGNPEAYAAAGGFAEVSRAVVSVAADLVTGVQRALVGPDGLRTARDNAWDAILADRARNQARADLTREVARIVRDARVPARQAR